MSILDWTDDLWFSDFATIKKCGKLWEHDDDINNHYSNPYDWFVNLADAFVTYNKKDNTVTIDVNEWEEFDEILDYEDFTRTELLQNLNDTYNKINDINFVWVDGFDNTNV